MAAQLAELLFGVPEPLEEAVLVDPLDGPGADARVKQCTVRGALAATNAANVCRKEDTRTVYRYIKARDM